MGGTSQFWGDTLWIDGVCFFGDGVKKKPSTTLKSVAVNLKGYTAYSLQDKWYKGIS